MFWRRLISFLKRSKEPLYEAYEIDFDRMEVGDASVIIYYDDKTGETYSVSLGCTCQLPVRIIKMDDDYSPSLPHFECLHCDRVCTLKDCLICKTYSEMLKARLITDEPPQEQPPEQQ